MSRGRILLTGVVASLLVFASSPSAPQARPPGVGGLHSLAERGGVDDLDARQGRVQPTDQQCPSCRAWAPTPPGTSSGRLSR
jgi:hypothetical protein